MTIFLEYLKISLWMIPILLLALWLLPKLSQRYTAKLAYGIWLVLALRVVVPWNLTLPPEQAPIHLEMPEQTAVQWTRNEGDVSLAHGGERNLPAPAEVMQPVSGQKAIAPMELLCAIWGTGVALSLGKAVCATMRLQHLLRRWETAPSAEILTQYIAIAGENRPQLFISPAIETPLAIGFFRTKLYLPGRDYSAQELEMILRHEWIHWKRKDLWYKGLLLLVQGIYWFHPLMRRMVRRANRDLEIACDSEAVQEKDMAYRKAYSYMLLREAERSIHRQAALTTCFADGKKALQERLAEVMNGKRRRKGMTLVAMTLILALSCGCFVSYGENGVDTLPVQESTVQTEEIRALAEQWAAALESRDGKQRYAIMSRAEQEAFIAEQKGLLGEEWNYVIGWSSPWVIAYTVEPKADAALITYTMQDSSPSIYTMQEVLQFGTEDGRTVVTNHITSNTYWEDGKVYPVRTTSGVELEEGILDFLTESVVGFISQSKWSVYELEQFAFDIKSVETEQLDAVRTRVTVDFDLHLDYRNSFCDPDEVSYIQQAKAEHSSNYKTLYAEYYKQQMMEDAMRFTMDMQTDAATIIEDTVFPESICIYSKAQNHPKTGESGDYLYAYQGYYEIAPTEPWYCKFQLMQDEETLTVNRLLWIADNSGRTNRNFFAIPAGYGQNITLAEDVRILLGEAGEELMQVTAEEWMQRLQQDTRSYTAWFGETADGDVEITEIREGHWITEDAAAGRNEIG